MSSRKKPIAARRSSGASGCFCEVAAAQAPAAARPPRSGRKAAAELPEPRVGQEPVQELVARLAAGIGHLREIGRQEAGIDAEEAVEPAHRRLRRLLEILEQDHLELPGRESAK